jgi:multidrug efflux pump subunit AcrA (membrane-fusion protein)
MVPVVVEVPRPLDVSDGKLPLYPGTFVKVLITGKTLENAIAIPRDAIRDRDIVWLVNDGQLHITPLDVVRADDEFAYVTSGVADGALIVTSALDVAVDQMAVRIPQDSTKEELADSAAAGAGPAGGK